MVRRLVQLGLPLALVAVAGACSPTIRYPRLASPGTGPRQPGIAEQFDPYPLPDLGPEIVGGRPPDFAVPSNEVTRARQFRPNGPGTTLPVIVPQVPAYTPTIPPSSVYPTAPAPNVFTPPPVNYRY
ncbi:MAG TPA: hypothetical protein PJ982_10730 [Lacipirellulaceae bacterium]|nr:hypothetical protein [Lacipirellulaceae bacterium]